MNYTKGKWEIGRYGKDKFEVLSDKRIAIIDNIDDANLISAAPDMYEALQFTIRQIKELHKIKGEFGLTNAIIGLAELTLAKAEGK